MTNEVPLGLPSDRTEQQVVVSWARARGDGSRPLQDCPSHHRRTDVSSVVLQKVPHAVPMDVEVVEEVERAGRLGELHQFVKGSAPEFHGLAIDSLSRASGPGECPVAGAQSLAVGMTGDVFGNYMLFVACPQIIVVQETDPLRGGLVDTTLAGGCSALT